MTEERDRERKHLEGAHYEFEMLVHSWKAMQVVGRGSIAFNICIEAFLVHARTLIDFFYLDKFCRIKKSDILAERFVPTWPTIRPADSAFLEDVRARANKQLAHLTVERVDLKRKSWETIEILKRLDALWNQFYAALPDDLHGEAHGG